MFFNGFLVKDRVVMRAKVPYLYNSPRDQCDVWVQIRVATFDGDRDLTLLKVRLFQKQIILFTIP